LATGFVLVCVLGFPGAASAGPRAAGVASQAHSTIEGTWAHNYVLVLESPANWPALVVSESDARTVAAIEAKEMTEFFARGLDPEVPALMTQIDGLPLVRGQRRTRILVDPADGKLPYRPQVLKALRGPPPADKLDNPEERPASERCLTGIGQPPLVSLTFATVLQIVPTKDAVAIHTEYGDEVRIVPITDTHASRIAFGRMGDSIGHWEGDTLVVETIGLPETDSFRIGPVFLVSGAAKVTERFTAVSANELLYQFTVDDPKTYTAPWRGEFSWYRTSKLMYEHACHEGNYSLPNILAGARHEEALAKAAAGGK
jgi:hypothetical protein